MKRQLNRSRFFVSSWYMGAGGLKNIFTLKPNKPFSKLKSFYGGELNNLKNQKGFILNKLTAEERETIRNKIKHQIEIHRRYQILAFSVSLIVLFVFFKLILLLFKYLSIDKRSFLILN